MTLVFDLLTSTTELSFELDVRNRKSELNSSVMLVLQCKTRKNVMGGLRIVLGMCGKTKFCSDSEIKKSEPSKNLTSLQMVF